MIEKIFTGTDEKDNFFSCKNGIIWLSLHNKPERQLKIGVILEIQKNGNTLLVFQKNEKEKDLHRATNSWSLPNFIYQRIDAFTVITEMCIYKCLKSKMEREINWLHFLDSGTEKKVYIGLNLFHKTLK